LAARPTTAKTAGKASPGNRARGAGPDAARRGAAQRRPGRASAGAAVATPPLRADARAAIEATVSGLGYEAVDVERAPRGLLRVTIDRLPGRAYPSGPAGGGGFVTVDDCETVTRQLQYALEVDGVAYERLEVSSPGLDRPLRTAAHYLRFVGAEISLQLKLPFQGRKSYRGVLGRAERGESGDSAAPARDGGPDETGWTLDFDDGQGARRLSFDLAEVREARLVPVVNFKKGRQKIAPDADGKADAVESGAQHGDPKQ
jgi:ribosome maturation factor RimP